MSTTQDPLALVVVNNGLDVSENAQIIQPFIEFLALAEEWKTKVATIKVTDVSQTREMKLARETRLALKEIRVSSNKKRIALKDESLKRGKMIDGLHAVVEGLIAPLEASLIEQEQFVERKEAERKSKLKSDREALLVPYGADTSFYDLGSMDDNTFKDLLDGMRITAENKAAEKKAADEERVRAQNAENERLAKLKEENDRLKAEKEVADRKAKEERDAQQAIIDKERRDAQAKADAAAVEAKKKQAELDEANRKVKAAEAAATAEKKRLADAEAKKKADEAEAQRKAALAPDKEKILAMAASVRAIQVPEMLSAEGISVQIDTLEKIDELATWIENKAKNF